MNAQQFTQEEQASFTQALRYGLDYIATLNNYQKARLADLAREKQYRAVQVHTERYERHPYAPQQAGQLDYWLDNVPAYKESRQILALLAEPATLPTVTIGLPDIASKPVTKSKLAELQHVELTQVKSIFEGLQQYLKQPGEWATALVALQACGCLVGNPYEVERWFNANSFNGRTSRRSIADRQDYVANGSFNNASEKRIFEAVYKEVTALKNY